jgi:hypothetical protein
LKEAGKKLENNKRKKNFEPFCQSTGEKNGNNYRKRSRKTVFPSL